MAHVDVGGRPRIPIDWEEFDKLCMLQCTIEEIAHWFNCSTFSIRRAVKREKGVGFATYFEQKRGRGKVALRRKQMQTALDGSVPMMIFLGKQYLGQTDKQDIEHGGVIIKIVETKVNGERSNH